MQVFLSFLVWEGPCLSAKKKTAENQTLEEFLLLFNLEMLVVVKQFPVSVEFLMCLSESGFDLSLELG